MGIKDYQLKQESDSCEYFYQQVVNQMQSTLTTKQVLLMMSKYALAAGFIFSLVITCNSYKTVSDIRFSLNVLLVL